MKYEYELKRKIFAQHPQLANVRALAWTGPREIPTSSNVGVAVVPADRFDGWRFILIPDKSLRDEALAFIKANAPGRWNCSDDDAILVLAVLQ